MHRGNQQRTTASTQMNDVSSRSHAIFTITFVQASYQHNNMPSETVSKVHLVDLAGSERADATGATGQRLVEGAHINKSLVTLGSVISALADSSQRQEEVRSSGNKTPRKAVFIPYRDSVLTWLLKDSLGGNSKTIMIAAISPADCNYGETLSTLRYANRAKNIINTPTINEDPNVKLIRELREEINKLRAQISNNTSAIDTDTGVLATLQRKEAQEKVLTEKWTEKWRETQQILQEQKALGLRKSGLGVVLDSDMPHLIGIDDNLLSTGVTLYHLKEGETLIGTAEHVPTPDIIISGNDVMPLHCRVSLEGGEARLRPAPGAPCWLNTVPLDTDAKLSQGCIILLGRTNMFRYNDPAEAAKLRQEGSLVAMNLSRLSLLSCSNTDLALSNDNLLSELESDARSEALELQRAELERERQLFQIQQEERQQQLLDARRRLDEERVAMEQQYNARFESASAGRRAKKDVAKSLASARDCTEQGEAEVNSITRLIEAKQREIEEFAKQQIDLLKQSGVECTSPESESSTECLLRIVKNCDPVVQEALDTHKAKLAELEAELKERITSVATHKQRVETLQRELRDMDAGEATESEPASLESLKRSKSELTLRPLHEDNAETHSADDRRKCTPHSSPTVERGVSKPNRGLRALSPDDDSDDMSSTEDYHKFGGAEGQSSSSERSFDRTRPRRRRTGVRRQVTEAEALRAMQRLCNSIAHQKGTVIAALEGDCSKEELNRQIAVLQDLQKKYVRLELALQYSLFSRTETNATETTRQDHHNTNCTNDHPLARLKESELEASDNVSTSNDESGESAWEGRLVPRAINDTQHVDTIPTSLSVPVDYDAIVSIPGWVTRGAGASTHYEYEVRIAATPGPGGGGGGGGALVLLRRYRRFRDLHLAMCRRHPDTVGQIPFPPRQLWSFERVARSRRASLERYLRQLLRALSTCPGSPLYRTVPTRAALAQTSSFFRKGVFESGKCGTG